VCSFLFTQPLTGQITARHRGKCGVGISINIIARNRKWHKLLYLYILFCNSGLFRGMIVPLCNAHTKYKWWNVPRLFLVEESRPACSNMSIFCLFSCLTTVCGTGMRSTAIQGTFTSTYENRIPTSYDVVAGLNAVHRFTQKHTKTPQNT